MTTTIALRNDSNLDHYMGEIRKIPLLSRDEEMRLARRFRDQGDVDAARQLVVANLRFVVKIAHEYRNYGFRLLDLVQEGNIGLMLAVKKFDPDKGYRLISYAVWWIRAQIQSYVLKSWSLVKLGSGRARRKLFFRLRSERNQAQSEMMRLQGATADGSESDDGSTMTQEGAAPSSANLAARLGVEEAEVQEMELRLAARDFSLDAQLGESSRTSHLDMLASTSMNQEEALGQLQENKVVQEEVHAVMDSLNDKERYIVENRLMSYEPKTLQEIGDNFQISRERIRQLEHRVVDKLKTKLARLRNADGPSAALLPL